MVVTDTWSMEFDELTTTEASGITLPADRMLVALVRGLDAREWILCAAAEDSFVIRSVDGRLAWSETPGAQDADAEADLLPRDWPGEACAMMSARHLIEWVAADRYEITDTEVRSETSGRGPFAADLHPEYGFVLSVSVGRGGDQRVLVEVPRFRVAAADPALRSPGDLGPATVRHLLATLS